MGDAEGKVILLGNDTWHDLCKADYYLSAQGVAMHLFNRRPHEGSSSVIQIGEGLNVIDVEIIEVVGEQVILGVFAPRDVPVQRKEVVVARQEEARAKPPTVQ